MTYTCECENQELLGFDGRCEICNGWIGFQKKKALDPRKERIKMALLEFERVLSLNVKVA